MATRLLEACANSGGVRFVCLQRQSRWLFHFRHLVHIWVKLPVTMKSAMQPMLMHGKNPHSDQWLSAADGMGLALMELASSKEDRRLSASKIALLPEGREELKPFADWLREDQQVQKRAVDAWNSVIEEGPDHELPRAFSVQLVNNPGSSQDDSWLSYTRRDYDPL